VPLQIRVREISERAFRADFCTLVGGVLAANDSSLCFKCGLSRVEHRERRKLSESDSAHPSFDSAFPYETLGARVRDAKGEALQLIISDEDLTVLGDSNCFDESLGDIGHVDAM